MPRGNIETRGENRHRIRIFLGYGPNGKQLYHRETFYGTRREAEKYMQHIIARMNSGDYVPPNPITLSEFLDQWMEKDVRPRREITTIATYERHIAKIKEGLGHIRVQKLRPVDIEEFYSYLLTEGRTRRRRPDGTLEPPRGLSPTTVNQHHRTLHAALEKAVKWGIVTKNVASEVTPPQARRRKDAWSVSELKAFLACVSSHRLYAMYALALTTGMRRGELGGLRWEDVDLDANLITVRQVLVTVTINGKRTQVFKERPKTEESESDLSISPAVSAILREHRRRQAEERLLMGSRYEDHGLVFCQRNGKPLRLDNLTSRDFPALCEKAGVRRIRFHDLRHSYATYLFEKGEALPVVGRRLRHTEATTTVKIYAHVRDELERRAARLTDDILPSRDRLHRT